MEAQDRRRFELAVLPHLNAAYTLARYLLRDPHDAEDAVQEASLRAVRHFSGFRGEDGRTWLLAIVRNCCHSWRRSHRTDEVSTEFDEEQHTGPEARDDAGAALDRADAAEQGRRMLDQLPAPFREVLVLREVEGLSYREIAEVVGTSIGTVMSRLSRARTRLQRLTEGRS